MLRVILVDDHQLVRQCLRMCLGTSTSVAVVGEAASGEAAIDLASQLTPDVVVLDVSLPGMAGPEVAVEVLEKSPRSHILALSMHAEREFIMSMFRAGATGYVLKASAYDELLQAIVVVGSGGTYVSPGLAGHLLLDVAHGRGADGPAPLTPREKGVLCLLGQGLSTKEAAWELGLSDKTVHAVRGRLQKKLGLRSTAELIRFAIRSGMSS